MRARASDLGAAVVPALFLALLSAGAGTLPGSATFGGAVLTQLAVLGLSVAAARAWRDPLGLGSSGVLLLLALLAICVASWWTSPVRRAGSSAVILLPFFLGVPAAVAACWSSPRRRRIGLVALAVPVAAVSGWALVDHLVSGSPRAAMPLGQHNLLAGWLVLMLPLTLLPARRPGLERWTAIASGALAIAALLASRSLTAALALGAQALLAAFWWRWARPWLPLGGGLLGATYLARAISVAALADPSARARLGYAAGGLRGLAERPGLGWGPGSTPWAITQFLRPEPGVNPPSEVVGDLHSLPIQLAFELGASGLLLTLAVGLLFAWRRWREREDPEDPGLLRCGLVSLAGGGVFLLASAPLTVPALPAALALAVGASLAGGSGRRPATTSKRATLGWAVCALAAAGVLAPADLAHLHYDRARSSADPGAARAQIDRAVELDPWFPLYRARRSWLTARERGSGAEVARESLRAARDARALAPLWLAAGTIAAEAAEEGAEQALLRAEKLDPLSPLPSFHLMALHPEAPQAAARGARALLLEPELASALFWGEHPGIRRRVAAELASGEDPDRQLRLRIVERLEREQESGSGVAILAQAMDSTPALSFSLYAFRRSPWPAYLAPIPIHPSSPVAEAGAAAAGGGRADSGRRRDRS